MGLLSFRIQRRGLPKLGHLALGLAVAALTACVPQIAPQINPGQPIKVALLAPQSDENLKNIAQSLEDAARLAVTDLGTDEISLTVYDTQGTAEGAQTAALTARSEGAGIIIGPLRAETSKAAAAALSGRSNSAPSALATLRLPQFSFGSGGLNILSFSNDSSIAGGNLFVLGNTWDTTAQRLLDFAATQGKQNIVILHPRTPEGTIAKDTIMRTAEGITGVSVTGARDFTFSQEGVVELVAQIRADYALDPENPDFIPSPAPDAFFLTSNTAGALPLLAQLLSEVKYDSGPVQLMGLTRWDQPPQTLTLPGLQGGWFAMPDPAREARFKARFASVYGKDPHQLAGLAYDAIAAIGALHASGRKDATAASGLTQPAGFFGAAGVFRLNQNRTNSRALAVAEIRNRNVVILDPSPNSFAP